MDSAFLPNPIINLSESRSGGDPCRIRGDIYRDVTDIRHVEDEKWFVGNVRETIVVMAAASDFEEEI